MDTISSNRVVPCCQKEPFVLMFWYSMQLEMCRIYLGLNFSHSWRSLFQRDLEAILLAYAGFSVISLTWMFQWTFHAGCLVYVAQMAFCKSQWNGNCCALFPWIRELRIKQKAAAETSVKEHGEIQPISGWGRIGCSEMGSKEERPERRSCWERLLKNKDH